MAHALALVTPLVLAALLPFQGVGREATRLTQARVTPPRLDVAPDLPWASTLQAHGRSYLLTRPVLLKRGAKGSVREGVASLLEAVHRETGCAQKTRRVWDAFVCAHRLHRPQVCSACVCVCNHHDVTTRPSLASHLLPLLVPCSGASLASRTLCTLSRWPPSWPSIAWM